MRLRPFATLVVAGVCLGTGCARHMAPGLSQRFIRPGEPTTTYDEPSSDDPSAKPTEKPSDQPGEEPPRPTLQEQMSKLRYLQAQARPAQSATGTTTIEQQDADLAVALARMAVFPTGKRHREVADQYRRLNLLDRAYEHYSAAVRLNQYDAAAYEGLARIWRDWGMSHLGLTEAHRAVFYAPLSASAHNTLGTVLQALGQRSLARDEYLRAARLDPEAAYALNNLCYTSFLDGRLADALQQCNDALGLDPDLTPVRNNLALVYAASGLMTQAEKEFEAAADPGTAAYNIGIVHLAERHYLDAIDAFRQAEHIQPFVTDARARTRQARRLADQEGGGIQ